MKHNVKHLIGYTLGATDGEIGKVRAFYFDDKTWTVRYLVVETGNWLSGRSVLISPEAVLSTDQKKETLLVNLTREQVKNSPDIDTEKPVSRQQEIKLYEHYPWTNYWGASLWGGGIGTAGMVMPGPGYIEPIKHTENDAAHSPTNDDQHTDDDQHLRSTKSVTGYSIKATDGDIGDVEDFIFDDSSWKILYLLVDTGNWFPGKKVLISPQWIKEIKWDTSDVIVNTSVEQVKNSPEYEPGEEISESYEANLQNHYGRLISHKQ